MQNVSTKQQLSYGNTLNIKTFDWLTTTELYDLLHVRTAVFVVERNYIYQDVDYNDQSALHIWITDNDGKIPALSRICLGGTKPESLSIGRVVSTECGKGYGALIFQKSLDAVRQNFPEVKSVKIETQLDKQHFYERFGFYATSEPFDMDDLMHIDMELDIQ